MTDDEYNELINSNDIKKIEEFYARRDTVNGIIVQINRGIAEGKEKWLREHYESLIRRRNNIRKLIVIALVVLLVLILKNSI